MTRIGDQRDRVGQEPEAALYDHEHHIERHRDAHPGIDAVRAQRMAVGMRMRMVVLSLVRMVVLRAVVVVFHRRHYPSIARR